MVTMINNGTQRKMGIILQYIQMGLSIIIQLIYTPIMLRILGASEYGIYNVASSTIAYLSVLSLGFGSSYLRYYSMYKKENDNDNIAKLNGLYLIVFFAIGIIAMFLGGLLTRNVSYFFNKSYTRSEIRIARILMRVLVINLSVSFPVSVFNSYIISQEKFIFQKIINLCRTVIGPCLSIIVLYCGYGSVGMVVLITIVSLIMDFIIIHYCLKKLKMKIDFRNPNFYLFKDIFIFSIFIAINEIVNQINWQTDKIILGKIVNGTAVAIYSVGASINTFFISFSTAISSVFAPKINKIVSENRKNMEEELTRLFIKVGKMQWYIIMLVFTGFVFFGRFFIKKWAGNEYGNSYYVAIFLMAPAIIPLIQNLGIEIQRARNMHQFRSIVYLIMAVVNVVISVYLAKIWAEIGVALGTTFSFLIANGIIINIFYHKKLGINVIRFWHDILRTIPGLVLPISTGILISRLQIVNSIKDFIVLSIVYIIIYISSIYFFSLNNNERSIIKKLLSNRFTNTL